jgi:hypothetical protein
MEQQARNGNVRYVRCYCEVENLYYKGCRLKVFLQLKKFLRDAATHKDERKERSKVLICSIFVPVDSKMACYGAFLRSLS